MQEYRHELVAAAGTRVYRLLQLLASRVLRTGQGEFRQLDELIFKDLKTSLFSYFLRCCAGECTTVVDHACRELRKGEGTSRNARLKGEDYVFVFLGLWWHVVGL